MLPSCARRRTGNLWRKPDLTVLGKIIGGALPVGVSGGRAEIMEQLRMVRCIRQEPCLEIRSQWLPVWRSCANSNESTAGNCSTTRAQLEALARDAQERKRDITFHRLGSMFCLFCCRADFRSRQRAAERSENVHPFFSRWFEARRVFCAVAI